MEEPSEIRRRIVGKKTPQKVPQLPLPDPLAYGPPLHDVVVADDASEYAPSIAPADENESTVFEDVPLVSKLDPKDPKMFSGGGRFRVHRFRVQKARFRVQKARCRLQKARCRFQKARFRFQKGLVKSKKG